MVSRCLREASPTVNEKQVAVQPLAAFLPASLRLLVELPDGVEDPATSALDAGLELLGLQLDFLGVDNLARVEGFLPGLELAVGLEEDPSPDMFDVRVVDESEVGRVMGKQVASVGCMRQLYALVMSGMPGMCGCGALDSEG